MADYFTKWMEAYAIPNQEAPTIAQKLVDEFFCRFSLPEQLHSDQGRQFESAIISQICSILHIEKTRTTPYHPQSDGLVERFNRTLTAMLATYADTHPFDWEYHLPKVCMAYNASEQVTTGYSPFYLMFGRQARIPADLICAPPQTSQSTPSQSEFAKSLCSSLSEAYQYVCKSSFHQIKRQEELYNRKVHGMPHKKGSLVWLYNTVIPRGHSKKFHRPWTGPYQVVKQLSESTYRVRHVLNNHYKNVHFD